MDSIVPPQTPAATPAPIASPQPIVPSPIKPKNPFMGLVIIILLLSFAAAGFFAYKNWQLKQQISQVKPTPTPIITPSATPDPMANWKTFTNSTWGYSFKYPPQWGVSTGGDDVVLLMSNAQYLTAREKWDDANQGPFAYPSDDYGQITFSVYKKGVDTAAGMVTDQTDIKVFVQKMFATTYSSITDMTLGGRPAIAFISDEMVEKPGLPPHMQDCPPKQAPCLIPSGRKIKQVWAKINGNLFYMVYSQGGSYKDIDTLPALFDQIISTFKFTR